MKTITRTITASALALMLAGCSTIGGQFRESIGAGPAPAQVLRSQVKADFPQPAQGPVAVAVYNFRDMTGQRKNQLNVASLSSAVTQGGDAFLVKSLQDAGNGRWFKVLERGGLDNIVKERQLIRQMREIYEGNNAQALPPMLFASMIVEGGIVGYDSNIVSGGSGARLLGIGGTTEYRQDEIIINIRLVSVATGEVLSNITTSKTVISWQDKIGVLRFNSLGTQSLELESGAATNESMNRALQIAIDASVDEMIYDGEKKGYWQFKPQPPKSLPEVKHVDPVVKRGVKFWNTEDKPAPAPKAKPEAKPAAKLEEKKNELVQKETPPAPVATAPVTPAPQPPQPTATGGNKEESKKPEEARVEPKPVAVAPQQPVKVAKVAYATSPATVRKDSTTTGEPVGTIKKGQPVEIVDSKNGRHLIAVNGKTMGWVYKDLIKEGKENS